MDKTIENAANKFLNLTQEKGQKSSFPWSIILWVLGILVVGLLFYISFSKRRELAKLIHEKNVAEEEKIKAETYKKVAANQAVSDRYQEEIVRLEQDILKHNQNIEKMQEEAKQFEDKLNAVKNWKEVNHAFGDK